MKRTTFIFLCLINAVLLNAQNIVSTVKMDSGETGNVDKLEYRNDNLYINGNEVSPDDVSHIVFQKQQEKIEEHKLQTGNIGKEELLARAFCHETEHLDGRMFMEHVTEWIEVEE